jgi:hypothetical protein
MSEVSFQYFRGDIATFLGIQQCPYDLTMNLATRGGSKNSQKPFTL